MQVSSSRWRRGEGIQAITLTGTVERSPGDITGMGLAACARERPVRDRQRAFVHVTSHRFWLVGGQVKDRALAAAVRPFVAVEYSTLAGSLQVAVIANEYYER
jgi:hypothetical protein